MTTLHDLIERGASVDDLMDAAAAQAAAGDPGPVPEGLYESIFRFTGAVATRDAALLDELSVEDGHPTRDEQAHALAFLLGHVDLPHADDLRLHVLAGHLPTHHMDRLADLLVELIERARIQSCERPGFRKKLALLLDRPPRARREGQVIAHPSAGEEKDE